MYSFCLDKAQKFSSPPHQSYNTLTLEVLALCCIEIDVARSRILTIPRPLNAVRLIVGGVLDEDLLYCINSTFDGWSGQMFRAETVQP